MPGFFCFSLAKARPAIRPLALCAFLFEDAGKPAAAIRPLALRA
jgi:hypothetical protein